MNTTSWPEAFAIGCIVFGFICFIGFLTGGIRINLGRKGHGDEG